MGAITRSRTKITYLRPWYGILAETSNEPREGFVFKTVQNMKGEERQKYVKEYREGWAGYIDSVEVKMKEMPTGGESAVLLINLIDYEINERCVIQLPFSSLGSDFAKKLDNLDFNKFYEIKTAPPKAGSTRQSIFVMEADSGRYVKNAYTKENPNGMPEAVETIKLGQTTKDYTSRENFFWTMVEGYSSKVANIARERSARILGVTEPNSTDTWAMPDVPGNNGIPEIVGDDDMSF